METEYAYRQAIYGVLLATFTDGRLLGLLLLQFCDMVCGAALAVKEGRFAWQRLADWFGSEVLPKGLGWAALSVTCGLVNTTLFAQSEVGGLVEAGLPNLALATILASLVAGIFDKAARLGILPQRPAPPPPVDTEDLPPPPAPLRVRASRKAGKLPSDPGPPAAA